MPVVWSVGFLNVRWFRPNYITFLQLYGVAFQKGAQLPNKPMKVIAGFLGYYGTESTLPISTMIDLNLVKPKLADGMWLGERCVDEEQLTGFRPDLESS